MSSSTNFIIMSALSVAEQHSINLQNNTVTVTILHLLAEQHCYHDNTPSTLFCCNFNIFYTVNINIKNMYILVTTLYLQFSQNKSTKYSIIGYWRGGTTSTADSCESVRTPPGSTRIRRTSTKNIFRRTPPNVRRTFGGLRGELAEEFTRKMSADKNLPNTTVPRGKTSAADVLPK